jgi:hypothetical protein
MLLGCPSFVFFFRVAKFFHSPVIIFPVLPVAVLDTDGKKTPQVNPQLRVADLQGFLFYSRLEGR